MGALNNLMPFCFIAWGQTRIASGLAAILNATTSVFTVVLAHIATHDERMTPNRLGGVLLGVVGVAVMIGPGALGGVAINVLGRAAILGAAICYDCAGIFGRRFLSLPPMVAATGQVTTATVMVLPFALFIDRPWVQPMPGMAAWIAIASAGARLCAVFPHPGHRRGDRPAAGDLDHARRRGVSWHGHTRRADPRRRLLRDGADRSRPHGD